MIATTCDLFDRFGDAARVINTPLMDFGGRKQFSGTAVTVKCFEDNSRLKELAGTDGTGKILLVDGGGSLRVALLGDMIAATAAKAGWAGIIIFGCVRDKAALRTVDLGIKALGTTPRKSVRDGKGEAGLPIQIAHVWIKPGDTVYADEDGIVILDEEQQQLASIPPEFG